MKATVRYTLWYTPVAAEPTAGGGSCLWMTKPVYLGFDTFPFARSINWMVTTDKVSLGETLKFNVEPNYIERVELDERIAVDWKLGHLAESVTLVESFGRGYYLKVDETIKLSTTFWNGHSWVMDDSVAVKERGLLVSQSYFDTNTYFAADYFGESRTW